MREAEIAAVQRIRGAAGLKLSPEASESLRVREGAAGALGMVDGVLVVDRLTPERTAIVALTVAQSAAVESYERIVDIDVRADERRCVDRPRAHGIRGHVACGPSTGSSARRSGAQRGHRGPRTCWTSPTPTWDDPAMDAIYDDLRDEFDLVDRHDALEHKLRSVQESLELVLGVARDRRLVLLEASIVALIVLEILLSLVRPH